MAEGDPHLQEQVSAQEQGGGAHLHSEHPGVFMLSVSHLCTCVLLQDCATVGGGIPICWQAQTKLEVCLYMFLWSPDTEAVLVAMSCFRHLCEEADIRSAADEVPVQNILPNYATFSELASVSNMMGTGECCWPPPSAPPTPDGHTAQCCCLCTGRSTLQKRVMALLRRVEHPTPGNIEVTLGTCLFPWQQVGVALPPVAHTHSVFPPAGLGGHVH